MEGLIPFLIHAAKKHRLPSGYRSLSVSSTIRRHLLDGNEEGSSHHRTMAPEFLPPMAMAEQRSGFGYVSQYSVGFKKDRPASTGNSFHASKMKTT